MAGLLRILLPIALSTAPSIIKAIRGKGVVDSKAHLKQLLNKLSKRELQKILSSHNKEYSVKGYSKLLKKDIVELLASLVKKADYNDEDHSLTLHFDPPEMEVSRTVSKRIRQPRKQKEAPKRKPTRKSRMKEVMKLASELRKRGHDRSEALRLAHQQIKGGAVIRTGGNLSSLRRRLPPFF